MNRQLEGRDYLAGDYSIADMTCYPWVVPHEKQQQKLEDFPNLQRWFEQIQSRQAVVRAYSRASEFQGQPTVTEESRKILFNQTAETIDKSKQ